MSREQNIVCQERFATEVVNGGNLAVIDEVTSPDFVDHDPAPDQGPGPAGFKDFWAAFRGARARGTHQGDFMGNAATGRSIDIRGVQIARFVDGRMAERWGSSDQVTLMQQSGA